MASVQIGTTRYLEVIQILGPPDYIIDGAQRLIDEAAFYATQQADYRHKQVPTRVLPSPEGMVILIYSSAKAGVARGTLAGGAVGVDQRYSAARPGELFVFLSTADKIVQAISFGDPDGRQ